MDQQYFAINCDIGDLNKKIEDYFKTLYELGHTRKIQASYHYYYGQGNRASFLHTSGSQGQNTDAVVNDMGSLVRHIVTLVTANRPSFDCRATNTDYDSQAQTILGESILEYYLREKNVEKHLKKAANYAVKYSEGFIGLDWDVTMGSIVAADEMGQPVNEGDIRYSVYHPLQIVRDIYNEAQQDWVIVIQNINKYDLAAKYPEARDQILSLSRENIRSDERDIDFLTDTKNKVETDVVPFYTFYHRKCAALPEGRIAFFVESQVLQDGPLPYSEIPIYRVSPDNYDNTCLGFTVAWDLLGIQNASDQLYSSVISNNLAFSKQVLQTTRDNDINVSDLADGMMLIESDAPIQPVQLTKSAPETYELINRLQSKQQELSGINEVIRGVPSPNLRSGNSMALIAAQAITYNSGIEGAYNGLIEDVGTATLRMLKDFAVSPRFAAIVGKYKQTFMKSFKGADLDKIDRVTVDMQGSVMKTTAGKVQLAENLLQNGIIKRADQYLMVVETGKLDPLVESSEVELLLIRHENEMMAKGENPPVVAIDSHDLHIVEHKAVIANPEARMSPQVVQATLDHINEHINLKRTVSPDLLMLVGVQPLQPAAPQGGASPAPVEAMQPPGSPPPVNTPKPASPPAEADQLTQQSAAKLENIQEGGVQ